MRDLREMLGLGRSLVRVIWCILRALSFSLSLHCSEAQLMYHNRTCASPTAYYRNGFYKGWCLVQLTIVDVVKCISFLSFVKDGYIILNSSCSYPCHLEFTQCFLLNFCHLMVWFGVMLKHSTVQSGSITVNAAPSFQALWDWHVFIWKRNTWQTLFQTCNGRHLQACSPKENI